MAVIGVNPQTGQTFGPEGGFNNLPQARVGPYTKGSTLLGIDDAIIQAQLEALKSQALDAEALGQSEASKSIIGRGLVGGTREGVIRGQAAANAISGAYFGGLETITDRLARQRQERLSANQRQFLQRQAELDVAANAERRAIQEREAKKRRKKGIGGAIGGFLGGIAGAALGGPVGYSVGQGIGQYGGYELGS